MHVWQGRQWVRERERERERKKERKKERDGAGEREQDFLLW